MRALEGIRILDLTHMVSGPYCTMMLADLGAETIKIEPLESGEATRKLLAEDPNNTIDGMNVYLLVLGRNKKSVSLDLKQEAGKAIFYDLVKHADVVVNNFRPGVPERLKIDHASLSAINPRIVTCSITGFGNTGPGKDRTAYDMVAQGYGGGMSLTGEPGGNPVRAGLPIGDLSGGMFATMGILAALQARVTTGKGQDVDISMVDGQISLLNYMVASYFLSGEVSFAMGNEHPAHMPYGTYKSQDIHVIIACVNDEFFISLADVLQSPILREARFHERTTRLENRDLINKVLNEEIAKWKGDELLAILQQRGVPCGPVNTLDRALKDPQVLARDMVVEGRHPNGQTYKMPGNPIKLSDTPCETFGSPPLVGQQTRETLKELLNLTDAELDDLSAQGVI